VARWWERSGMADCCFSICSRRAARPGLLNAPFGAPKPGGSIFRSAVQCGRQPISTLPEHLLDVFPDAAGSVIDQARLQSTSTGALADVVDIGRSRNIASGVSVCGLVFFDCRRLQDGGEPQTRVTAGDSRGEARVCLQEEGQQFWDGGRLRRCTLKRDCATLEVSANRLVAERAQSHEGPDLRSGGARCVEAAQQGIIKVLHSRSPPAGPQPRSNGNWPLAGSPDLFASYEARRGLSGLQCLLTRIMGSLAGGLAVWFQAVQYGSGVACMQPTRSGDERVFGDILGAGGGNAALPASPSCGPSSRPLRQIRSDRYTVFQQMHQILGCQTRFYVLTS